MSTELERRVSASPIPLRSEGRTTGADGRRLIGYAAVFNSLSENLGGMREIIEPGAFSKALRTSDVRALLNHDPSLILGRTKAGTLRLKEDATGLRAEIDIPKTPTGDGVLESVRRGDISQMSFAFRIASGGDRFSTGKDGVTVRRILEVQELVDVSPVAFPAYSETVISARALGMARSATHSPDFDWITMERQRLLLALVEQDGA